MSSPEVNSSSQRFTPIEIPQPASTSASELPQTPVSDSQLSLVDSNPASCSCPIWSPTQNKDDGKMIIGACTCDFDQDNARIMELAWMIILHEYPISIVEHIGFRRYSNALQPSFIPVSRSTIKKYIMEIYDYEKENIMNMLERNHSRIAITTNMWTSSDQKKWFMAVKAHFIDDSWMLQSRILRFIYVPFPHTSEVLGKILVECLLDWKIDQKLSTLVDNYNTDDSMINIVLDKLSSSSLLLGGELLHIRCCVHFLNLIVKHGLDVIGLGIERIRDSVAYWTATPERMEKFDEAAYELNIRSNKKLALDCKTRWNSTYLMLHVAFIYKDVFHHLKQCESQYKCLLTVEDWHMANDVCEILKLFYDATELFSGTKYPTTDLYFPKICQIRLSLSEWLTYPRDVIRKMASNMIAEFDKYHGVMGMSTILDPRYKLKLFEFFFPQIYGDRASVEIERIRKIFYDLFEKYQARSRLDQGTNSLGQNSDFFSSQSKISNELDSLFEYDLFVANDRRTTLSKSELDFYLEEEVIPRKTDFDILAWWKANALCYPTLQLIARDILAVPISPVASEFAYSTSQRVVSPHRSSLRPNTLEALMCTKDWLWAEMQDSCSTVHSGCCYEDSDVDEESSWMETS